MSASTTKIVCPACGTPGHRVSATTVEQMTGGTEHAAWSAAHFCAQPECEVVYFDPSGARIEKQNVRVPVFQKESAPERWVCYCFEHSVAELLAAREADGRNRVAEAITDACRRGLDRCELANPQGRCCLGNVRTLLREPAPKDDCCGG